MYDGTLINYTESDICLNSKAELAIYVIYIFNKELVGKENS